MSRNSGFFFVIGELSLKTLAAEQRLSIARACGPFAAARPGEFYASDAVSPAAVNGKV